MTKGILGRKVGMTEVFTTDGKLIPVTVVEVEANVVTQIKTVENDGYNSIQLGAFTKREKVSNKPEMGHIKKANTTPKRFLKEIKGLDVSNYEVGQVIGVETFEAGEIVDVTGTSKGKGFQGVIKRHGQSEGPKTHGSRYHRRPGSMGTMRPMRVLKGKKLAGHMGHETVTVQNLEIIEVNVNENYILVSGNVPGPKHSLVLIRNAAKGGSVTPKEIVTYGESVNEVIDETSTNVEPTTVESQNTEPVESTETEVTTAEEPQVIEEVTEEVAGNETNESQEEEKAEA